MRSWLVSPILTRINDAYKTKLESANSQLSALNNQLKQSNLKLHDSNRVKDEYITKFFSICSSYIDKLENYRIKVNRKLKAKQYSDLLQFTSSSQMKEDELKELFDGLSPSSCVTRPIPSTTTAPE